MKKQVVLTRKELNEYIDKQANNIIENLLKKKSELSENKKRVNTTERLTNRISESIMRKMGLKKSVKLNESIGNDLFVEIRFVQGGDDDYNEIEQMFCGEQNGYCKANSQPVIDYLKQWDDGENEPTPNQPRIARGDTQYADENGDYTLLYNSSVGVVSFCIVLQQNKKLLGIMIMDPDQWAKANNTLVKRDIYMDTMKMAHLLPIQKILGEVLKVQHSFHMVSGLTQKFGTKVRR